MIKKPEPITSCETCPVGVASGVLEGEPCGFVDRIRRPGESLYLEGEPVDRVWFIRHGSVALLREAGERQGEGVAWTVRSAGAVLGLECLARTSYVDSARALSCVRLCVASQQHFVSWLANRADAARTTLELVVAAGCYDAPRPSRSDGTALERVARWLIDESPRRNGGGLPRRVVAQLLGMLPETLSRALAELARRGAIELTRRKITIRDVDALAAAAGADGGA
jgi:CRP-like cAMP-binding protein